MTTKKQEVAKVEPMLPAPIIDYGTDAGAGVDTIGRDEAGIPFLKILQAQSPEVIGPNGKIEGAAAGMILNTGSSELSDTVTVVPAIRQHVFVEWRNKKEGGGIINVFEKGSPEVAVALAANAAAISAGEPSKKPNGGVMRYGEYYTAEGNNLVETFYVFGVVLNEGRPSGMVVIPFSSTAIKKYKRGFINRVVHCLIDNGQGAMVRPPMFAHQITLGTTQETNDDGTWSNYDIKFAVDNNVQQSVLTPDAEGYIAAKALAAMVEGGAAKADTAKAGAVETDGGEEADDSQF